MGIFKDSPEEQQLRDAVNEVARLVGRVVSGRSAASDLHELMASRADELQHAYDAVAATKSTKAAKKLLDHSYDIAEISADSRTRAAWALMDETLATLDRPFSRRT